ncbi:hypothetical protein PINS_up014000 [Pythium insidiosum]|nr:hypothetical protein PINS_up014000 [Pythium insidiosum]
MKTPTVATSDARSIAATPSVKIDATALEDLLAAIRTDPSIQSLELRRVGLTPSLAVQLADFLETNTTLTALDVSGNSIGGHGARCLAASLGQHTKLQRVSLAACGLGADAVAAWKEYVCAHPTSPLSAIEYVTTDDE